MKRLDQDLSRFTIELEADTAGITEVLEQSKSLYQLLCMVQVHIFKVSVY